MSQKVILFIGLLIALAVQPMGAAFAQPRGIKKTADDPSRRVYLGIEYGATFTKLLGADGFGFRFTYPYENIPSASLLFNDLGSGWSSLGGVRIQYPLSRRFGLIGGIHFIELQTGSSETMLHNPEPEITGGGTATTQTQYAKDWAYTRSELLLRYIPWSSWFYTIAGAEVGTLFSDRFDATQHIVSGGKYINAPPNSPTSLQLVDFTSDGYYAPMRIAAKIGIGTMLPISFLKPLVATPELSISIPLTPLFTPEVESIYASENVRTPNLFYLAFSLSVSYPLTENIVDAPAETPVETNVVSTNFERDTITRPMAEQSVAEHPLVKITGIVRDDSSGRPLVANVIATDLALGITSATAQTDSMGSYKLELQSPGRYSITAESSGHLFRSISIVLDASPTLSVPPLELRTARRQIPLLVFFGFDNATLAPESYPELMRVKTLLQSSPSMKIEISGYTDNEGSDAYNESLSERRAEAVRSFLVIHGVEAARITTVGYGKSHPITSNATNTGRAQNRRVEMKVVKP